MAGETDCAYLWLDSGSTDRVFRNKDHFVEYDTNVPMQHSFIYTADGTLHKVESTGFVHIRVKNGDSFFVVPLIALHVPTFAVTLVSTDCLVQRGGLSFAQTPHGPKLTKNGQKWADVNRQRNGLSLVHASIIMPGSSGLQANLSIGMLWHGKLGTQLPLYRDRTRYRGN